MSQATLTIEGDNGSRKVQLDPDGTIIGRSSTCDVVIDSPDVSRHHARVFEDPFGRWLFEDLGSSNGVFVNGQRVEVCPVVPGDVVAIGPASVSIQQPMEHQIEAEASLQPPNIVVENFGTEVFYSAEELGAHATTPHPERLAEITRRLSDLTSLAALYPEVCRSLAREPKTVAAVFRLPAQGQPIPKTPEVLACHFGSALDETAIGVSSLAHPSHLAFRVSRRVLDAVRSKGQAVMAKSIYSCDTEITITLIDEHSPRAVVCAPLGSASGAVDLLYFDLPLDEHVQIGAEEMFAFVQAVAQQVVSVRTNLTPVHVKSERRALDHELSLAHQMQLRMAPAVPESTPGIELGLEYRPVAWVGGDYCDVWMLDDECLAFAVGHVSERGLPAAMAISNLRSLIRSTLSLSRDLAAVVKHLGLHLSGCCPDPCPATLFLGLLEATTGTFKYVNVGHPEPIIAHPRSGIRPLGQRSQAELGHAHLEPQANAEKLTEGSILVACSEGVASARSADGETFGTERLEHLLTRTEGSPASRIASMLARSVKEFQGRVAQRDDMTFLVLTRQP